MNGEYVWNRLLRYQDLISDDAWKEVAKHALSWLRKKDVGDAGVDQIVNSLLTRTYCLQAGELEFIVRIAIELLRTSLPARGRRILLGNLEYLARFLPDNDSTKCVINQALTTLQNKRSDANRNDF